MSSKILLLVVVILATWKEGACCSQINLELQNNQVYTFTSRNFPNIYPNTAHSCTFQGTAPVGQLIYVYCDTFNLPYDTQCSYAPFYFSPTGDPSYTDASIYCGTWPSLSLTTSTNQISMRFQNNFYDPYRTIGTFRCYVATWSTTTTATTPQPPTAPPTIPQTQNTPPTVPQPPNTPPTVTQPPNTPPAVTQPPNTPPTEPQPPNTPPIVPQPPNTPPTVTQPPNTPPTVTQPPNTPPTVPQPPNTPPTVPQPPNTPTVPPVVCECGRKNVANRIVGGQETSVSEYPWMVGLLFAGNEEPYCGGTLIDSQWVLTASHCVQPFLNTAIEVVVGAHELGPNIQSGNRVQVVQKIIHERYNLTTVDNDIALLKLAQPVSYTTNVSPVCLPFKFPNTDYEGMMGTATGWGTLTYQGNTPVSLNEVDLPIISQETCAQYHVLPTVLTNNMFCTLEIGKDACQGDSGGPLTITSGGRQYEVGVISWGIECATPDKPGVYARVNNYLQWIETKTGASFCKV
ncbi:Serine proteases trypsin domain [Trinorchestia longiramus]|nr:Serine proteases trypsin domain [Trinorchestia longiramus]